MAARAGQCVMVVWWILLTFPGASTLTDQNSRHVAFDAVLENVGGVMPEYQDRDRDLANDQLASNPEVMANDQLESNPEVMSDIIQQLDDFSATEAANVENSNAQWEAVGVAQREATGLEEAAQEALAEAADLLLPAVVEETQEEKRNNARLLDVDPNANRYKTYDGLYHHPFYQPNIAQDIHYTYRRFRKMKLVRHGTFWMGTNDPRSESGEYPVREIPVRSFYLDIYPVINAFYWAFRASKRFVRSEAEVKGWSWVTENVVSNATRYSYSTEGPRGWLAVKGARWDKPEGADSSLEDRWTHPVVHQSWYDAQKFCQFYGKRLPTEQEWEYAARAGLVAEEYPWGDRWERRRANTWQGKWPLSNSDADGYRATSPVDAYKPQNIIGLYDMLGNVWEWTHSRYYERLISRDLQGQMHVLKGGSFVDSVDGGINMAVRNGQRMGQSPYYTASNVGFRCARSAPEVDPKRPKPGDSKVKQEHKKNPKVPKIYRKPQHIKDEL